MQLGNDIVDLKVDTEIHPRFLQRILHPEEWERYPGIAQDPVLVWTLWAAKESAFKAYRQSNRRFFIPSRWNVDLETSQVQFETQRWLLNVVKSDEAVLATSVSNPLPFVSELRSGTRELSPREQSEMARKVLSELLERHAEGSIYHKDESGVPRLHYQGKALPFSMSHHGRHVHVCLALPNPLLH
ncbi:MAG: 4-phosphopantetheinyl transferase family protein [Proteobacteria bacterium]|nr:MAG: 4-phosphopantetheinyl transferase family protein [Pseudomonadota bacterium]